MPFVLRQENDVENPPLATVYGKQITQGKVVYYNGNKSIIFLGEGEMDGIDQLLYNGEILGAENWRFHAGTITKQIVPIDVTAISGEYLTLSSNPYNTTTESEVALVAGLDPTPSPFPTGVTQHQKLYVIESTGNQIRLSLTPGGTALTWTSSTYLLDNLKVYRANAGYFDSMQGRPEYFPDIDYTFSGICYVEVSLPAEMAEIEDEPSKFKVFVRGKRLQNFDANGLIADAEGVAYPDQNNLPAQTKFFSANNALVAVDIMLNYMRMNKTRIDWPSFVKYRSYCDAILTWSSGATQQLTYPTWINTSPTWNGLNNAVEVGLGTLKNVTPTDAEALSYQTIDVTQPWKMQAVFRGGITSIGISRNAAPSTISSYFAIRTDEGTGKVYAVADNTIVNLAGGGMGEAIYGDKYTIEGSPTEIKYYVNDELLHTHPNPNYLTGNPVRCTVLFGNRDSKLSDIKLYPLSGVSRPINRFDAHVVFPNETSSSTALETIFGRSPSVHWQDVDGKIKFVVGSTFKDLTVGDVATSGDRVLPMYISYDPTQTSIKSNIVENSFSVYKKPSDEKQNFLRMEYRDIEDEYFLKKYSYKDRPELRDYVGRLIDFGIVPLGVASTSLADRISEAVLRWNSDLDLFVQVKTMANTFALTKGDIVKFAHDIPGWDLDQAPLFIITEESFEPETADEKTLTLQIYSDQFYSDDAHGAISPSLPSVTSALTPPPPPTDITLTEETRYLLDGTPYSVIVGAVVFDSSYGNRQRARVYWKRPTDIDYTPTNIILEQPNTATTTLPFELNFAGVGESEVRVVTETVTGIVSTGNRTEFIDVTGTLQVEYVDWESLINTTLLETTLTKSAGAAAWDAGAVSTKSFNRDSGYVQVTAPTGAYFAIGLANYNDTTVNYNVMSRGVIIQEGQQPIPILNGLVQTAVGNTTVAGYGYKLEMNKSANQFQLSQTINGVTTIIWTAALPTVFPLNVKVLINTLGSTIPQPEMYGKLENTTGYKYHWKNIRGVAFSGPTAEIVTKNVPEGWNNQAGSYLFSNEYLLSDGALEFEVTAIDQYRIIGLSPADANADDPTKTAFDGIKYGIYLKSDDLGEVGASTLYSVREWNFTTNSYSEPFSSSYAVNDRFRIEKEGTTVRYRQNGVVVYTSTQPSSEERLYADVGFYTVNSSVRNIRLKKVGLFVPGLHAYPIYESTNLRVVESIPQDDGSVFVQLAGTFPAESDAPILTALVKVYDKFGAPVKEFPPFTYSGNGVILTGFHPRKYSDPFYEAIYEIRLVTTASTSIPIYFQGDGTTFTSSLNMPALLNIATHVKDLSCSSVDHQNISVAFNYSGNVDIFMRNGSGAWSTVATNVASPRTISGLVPDTYYEFRAAPTGTTANYSNIVRCKTLQAPLPADQFPPPLNLTGAPKGTSPTDTVTLSWSRNSSTNTNVEVFKNGVSIGNIGSATATTFDVTGLTADTTYTFKVRNVYASGNSGYSNEISVKTAAVESASRPSNLTAQTVSGSRIDLRWVNNTGSGTLSVERSVDAATWSVIASGLVAGTTYMSDYGLATDMTYYYRVSNSTVAGYSNIASASTYTIDDTCVSLDTWIWVFIDGKLATKQAKDVKKGDTVLTVTKGGVLSTTKVHEANFGKSDSLNIITTEGGHTLECTMSHPIIVDRDLSYIKGLDIRRNTQVLVYNELLDNVSTELVKSVETLYGEFDVVIFTLENEDHTFVSNNIVSHNRSLKY